MFHEDKSSRAQIFGTFIVGFNGCRRENMLVITLGCWWPIWYIQTITNIIKIVATILSKRLKSCWWQCDFGYIQLVTIQSVTIIKPPTYHCYHHYCGIIVYKNWLLVPEFLYQKPRIKMERFAKPFLNVEIKVKAKLYCSTVNLTVHWSNLDWFCTVSLPENHQVILLTLHRFFQIPVNSCKSILDWKIIDMRLTD